MDDRECNSAWLEPLAEHVPPTPECVPNLTAALSVQKDGASPADAAPLDPEALEADEGPLDEADDAPPVRILVAAADAVPLRPKGPVCIFSMGLSERAMATVCRGSSVVAREPKPQFTQVRRADGRVVCVGAGYPSGRWTEEMAEVERVRRAKQRPPKPTWRTKSKRLRQMIGEQPPE